MMVVSWFHSCGRQTEKQHYLILAHFEHEIANAGILICHTHSIKFLNPMGLFRPWVIKMLAISKPMIQLP